MIALDLETHIYIIHTTVPQYNTDTIHHRPQFYGQQVKTSVKLVRLLSYLDCTVSNTLELEMKRLQLGKKTLLFKNVYFIGLYLVILGLIILYNSLQVDFHLEKMRTLWMLKSGENP